MSLVDKEKDDLIPKQSEPDNNIKSNLHKSSLIGPDGTVIWSNPEGLGHFGIRLRKEIWEEWLYDQIKQKVPPEERARRWREIQKDQG